MELIRITEGGFYPELMGCGQAGRLDCDGVVIDAPGDTVAIGRLAVSQVRVPLIVKRVGRLFIDLFQPHSFWGDTANFRCGHVYINDYWPEAIQQAFDYDQYHQDVIFQAYAVQENGWELDPQGVIEEIHIQSLRVQSGLQRVNGVMLSERNLYRGLHLGTRELDVCIEAPWWLSANTLQHSVIGNFNQVSIRSESGLYEPSVRVMDVKDAGHKSHSNLFLCPIEGAVLPKLAGLGVREWDRV